MKHFIVCFTLLASVCKVNYAQQIQSADSLSKKSTDKKSLTFSGLLQARYTLSLTHDVDVNGKQFDDTQNGVTNSFSLRRVRLQMKTQINKYFDAAVLVNFAEFANSNLSGKVLENAYIRYTANPHFHVLAGQFRPFIGVEDIIPADYLHTLDYSNGYYSMSRNGWQSFQVGAAVYGDITKDARLRYFLGIQNGNGRNQLSDNDNGKHGYARLEADICKNIGLGVNAGDGTYNNKHGNFYGADIKADYKLNDRWGLLLSSEYKKAVNFYAYDTMQAKPDLSNVALKIFYIFSNVSYALNHLWFKTVELSNRYEYIDENYKLNSNPHQTFTPMIGLQFADNYAAYFQLGAIIDLYKNDIPKTTVYSHNALVAQLQIRF